MFFKSNLFPLSLVSSLVGGSAQTNFTSACKAISNNMLQEYPIGLGTLQIEPAEVSAVIRSAIQLGYRRFDCAPVYFNEDKVGDALTEELSRGLVNRDDLFIASKLASPFHRKEHVKIGLQKTLNDLRLDYLDLFLIHWPTAFHYVEIDPKKRGFDNEDIDNSDGGKLIDSSVSVHETWRAMEELVDQGLVRSIGVSNFPVALLHELMTGCRISPVVNQVEIHPYLQQSRLLDYCNNRGVHLQAFSPLGTPKYAEPDEPRILEDPILKKIADRHKVTVAQVCLAWSLQRNVSVVAKSASAIRQQENLASRNLKLAEEEMKEIASLDRGYRFFRPEDWWGAMGFAVFD
jgi:diketogulonate reductase-like aldo/keto reductase